MKKITTLVSVVSLLAPSFAFAHGDKLEMTSQSVAAALIKFKADHADQVTGFQGVKSWFDSDTVKVRVYLPNNSSMVYNCVHQEDANGEVVKCTMQM